MAHERGPLHTRLWLVCALALCAASPSAAQSEGKKIFEQRRCGACHQTAPVEAEEFDPTARSERTGPLLSHAGVKFRREWLVDWLQKPYRIRPAGAYPPAAIVADQDQRDQIDETAIEAHPTLSAAEAGSVADFLKTLTAGEERTAALAPEPKMLPKRIAELNFSKFKGCIACHQDGEGNGGLSGPELYSAWSRATPEFLFSYIQNPTAWDRHTMMPSLTLKDVEINKLLGYLQSIAEEETKQ